MPLLRINLMTLQGYNCTMPEFQTALASISFHDITPFYVVPDDDERASERGDIPADVIEILGPSDVIISLGMEAMFMRSGLWERIAHRLPPLVPKQ
jgi:hypothetical protein